MRVIAGTARGRRLKGPRDRSGRTRPSSDLVRGAVFDSLASMGADLARVLDLYAGTGALGIEALSRGAAHCDFVERDSSACSLIKDNLRDTGFLPEANVLCLPVSRALPRLQTTYTLVLADPPYDETGAPAQLDTLAELRLLAPGAVIVLEHSSRQEPAPVLAGLALVGSRRHGDTAVSIYR